MRICTALVLVAVIMPTIDAGETRKLFDGY